MLSIIGRGEGKRALDIGCAQGHLLKELSKHGWNCIGIDSDVLDIEVCRSQGLQVFEMDLCDNFPLDLGRFDLVILADVLEHLANPEHLLRCLHPILNQGASIVVSIPNIAHVSVRGQLLTGQFRYTTRGILDRTHLRFFTKGTITECLTSSGFDIRRTLASAAPLELVWPALTRSRLGRFLTRLNNFLPTLWSGGFAYQFILEAVPRIYPQDLQCGFGTDRRT